MREEKKTSSEPSGRKHEVGEFEGKRYRGSLYQSPISVGQGGGRGLRRRVVGAGKYEGGGAGRVLGKGIFDANRIGGCAAPLPVNPS